ncbi:hypothetical protein D3C74_333130 [compost metagenome]
MQTFGVAFCFPFSSMIMPIFLVSHDIINAFADLYRFGFAASIQALQEIWHPAFQPRSVVQE